ncbi:Proteasome assembly chaperone 2 [Dissophora globulifera]|nr:Proteasome assembly chaperone 2 [Dissophora globulifera]
MNTFVPSPGFDTSRFKGTTLILPSVSIGNVPQLTADLLLATLSLDRVGCIEDENVIPVIGPADPPQQTGLKSKRPAYASSSSSATTLAVSSGAALSLAVEVFQSKDGQWTLIQQRSPTLRHRSHFYTDNLIQFIKDSNFGQVVVLASADGARRVDTQLRSTTTPIRYIPSPALAQDLVETLQRLGLEQLEDVAVTEDEKREALIRRHEQLVSHDYDASRSEPAASGLVEQVEGMQIENEAKALEKVPRIPSGGIARRLHALCQDQGVPILTIVKFAMEGDNAPDAIYLANVLNAVLKVHVPTKQQIEEEEGWRVPKSWDSLYGNTFHQDMYQ